MVGSKSGHRSVDEVQLWGCCESFQHGDAGSGSGNGSGSVLTQYDVGVYVMACQGVRVSECHRIVVSLLPYAISHAVQPRYLPPTLDPALET